jgi:hypothetical protein
VSRTSPPTGPTTRLENQANVGSGTREADPLAKALNQITDDDYGPHSIYKGSALIPETTGSNGTALHQQPDSGLTGSSTTPVAGNDGGLRVEKITDPNLPTKILILNQPAPTEIGLQNPLSSSTQIPLAGQRSTTGTDPSGGIDTLLGQNYQPDDSVDKKIKQSLQKALKPEDGETAKHEVKKP